MQLCGLQKLSMLDYPGKVACTVFTGGCDLRCPFCHNGGLVLRPNERLIPAEEVYALLEKRRGILEGVCVTGGEPLMQRELAPFLARIKELGYPVKLDTNGTYPARLAELICAGLVDYVAMDVKNSLARYPETVGLPDFDPAPVLESIRLLLSGSIPFEFRTTVARELHSPDDIRALTRLISGAPRYYLQPYRDAPEILSPGLSRPSDEELAALLCAAREAIPQAELRG